MVNNIGIDLGSQNLHFYIQKENRFINSKSIIAIDDNKKEIISYGLEANKLVEKEPENVILKHPIKKGKIEDMELTIEMLKGILKKEKLKKGIVNPNILISYDRDLNEIEKNILIDTIKVFGCKNLYLMDSIQLACLGIGIEIEKNKGNMLIDIGYETTKIGIVSSNSIVKYSSISYGGNTFNEEMINYIRKKYKVLVGYSTIERIKKNKEETEIRGRNLITGTPTIININDKDFNNCVHKIASLLVDQIKKILEKVSPEILSDIYEKGIVITGGGSKLNGLSDILKEKLNIPILITRFPENSVIEGIKEVLDNNIKRATKI